MSDLVDSTLHIPGVTGPAGYAAGVDYPDWTITDDTVTSGGGGGLPAGYGAKVQAGVGNNVSVGGGNIVLTWSATTWATTGFVNGSRWSLDIQGDGMYVCLLTVSFATPGAASEFAIGVQPFQGSAGGIPPDNGEGVSLWVPAGSGGAEATITTPMDLQTGNYLQAYAQMLSGSGVIAATLVRFACARVSGRV